MRKRLTALVAYTLFWIVFFYFARLFFLIIHHREASEFSFGILAATFTHGIKLDISATAYILIFPLLAALPAVWIKGDWYRYFVRIYTWIILLVSAVIVAGDAKLYSYWGFRMDYTVLLYLKTPQEVAASVNTSTIIVFCLTVISITVLFGLIYYRLIDRMFSRSDIIRFRFPVTLFFMLLCSSLIIPIRGGTGVAPLNTGTVYFNDNMFVNHSAINVVWNAGSSYFNRKPSGNPYNYGDLDKAVAVTDSLTIKRGVVERVLNTTRPNILMIILESFGNSMVGPLGGDSLTTPCLNRLVKEGLLFSNFYASGNRTDKALPAILNGYPAQPAASIIKEPKKTQTLTSLVKIMNGLNYNCSFWYGGDINFANFNSFVIGSGFHQIITMENFDPSDYNSKWGVHDHVLFEALKDSMKVVKEPFFRVVLTLSSHEPFEVPMEPVFQGKGEVTKFRNSVYYTDKTVGSFITWAKSAQWWKNTLVILVADHCRRNSTSDLVYSQKIFKIPMLWLGGALDAGGKRIEKLGTQVDIPVTLLDQLDIHSEFPFAKDLLSDKSNSFAFYTFNEGFAFITDSSTVIYDQKLRGSVLKTGVDPEYAENVGKAYLQVLYNDFMKR
jgi:phosphoglycerol transferase MdoB-like AlkP superfamily enzyme